MKEKLAKSSFERKQALRAKRASLNDLDRFKVMINRKNRSYKVRQLAKNLLAPKAPVKAAPKKAEQPKKAKK